MAGQVNLAPEYRYYTTDLLTGELLAEIPFGSVSWERAVKGAGEFSGKIPVIESTRNLNLYETTMPGNTALYVVRNDVCVWGGIIWTRSYSADPTDHDLTVSASEFTSYFYHRKIWKTWNQEFGATVTINNGIGNVVFDYGSNTTVFPGSTVMIEYYDDSDFQYDGYYRVASSPAPTLNGFSIVGGYALADVATVQVDSGIATITTAAFHGFQTGDYVTVTTSYGSPFNGTFQVSAPGGSNTNLFTFPVTSSDIVRTSVTSGTATRPTPNGTYTSATITVRTDTYDYIRNLIDSVGTDFVGTDFPNVYIEPGISYALNVISKKLNGGLATLTTDAVHNLAVGQAVQIQDVGPAFDGEYEVLQVPAPNQLIYAAGGTLTTTAVAPISSVITAMSMANNVATITTSAAHNLIVGNHVTIFVGYDYTDFNGDQVVDTIISPTQFTYLVISASTIATKTLLNATATVGASTHTVISSNVFGNVATLTTADNHGFNVGNSVTISNVNRTVFLTEKSLDAPNSKATLTSAVPHGFAVGTTPLIEGVRDASLLTSVTSNGGTSVIQFKTQQRHNFAVGDTVSIDTLLDTYSPISKALTSNVATLTFNGNHNIPNGSSITVSTINDHYVVNQKTILNGVATITTSTAHNVKVNDSITVSGLQDSAVISALEVVGNIAIVTTASPHNYLENQNIVVSGLGAPYNFTGQVLSVTDTRVFYDITVNLPDGTTPIDVAPTAVTAAITSPDSYFNGDYTASAVTSTTVSYYRGGNNIAATADAGVLTETSVLAGTFTVTGVTATTVTYAVTGNNMASETIVYPDTTADTVDSTPLPSASIPSIFLGTHVLTAVTPNSISFAQTVTQTIPATNTSGNVSSASIFNGTRTITAVPATTVFQETITAGSNVLEEVTSSLATATVNSIFNGTYTITAVDAVNRTFSFARTYQDLPETAVQGYGSAIVYPVAIVSSFGPFPGNADINMNFSTRAYSGVNITPTDFRGFDLTTVGDALDKYSDSLDGFDYRIDCAYDSTTRLFTKTFVLIPVNFPNPPAPGVVSPISRFGADKLVFEYPGGSITSVQIDESAENSATRFFALGSTNLGPDAGPNISVASAQDLLSGASGRRWPILDDSEKVDDVDDESVLYAYAQRYLGESRPPDASFTISVNGSIAPVVGTYNPGDWCALIIEDDFIRQRLASDLEPRNDVIVRKIQAFKVTVPDSVTFPEKVDLTLVAEPEVDKIG